MRIGDIIGTVTLSRAHPSTLGCRLKIAVPLSWENLLEKSSEPCEEIVVWDDLGAGIGCRIALSEGREAAMPWDPDVKPLDAYNAAILDSFTVDVPEKYR